MRVLDLQNFLSDFTSRNKSGTAQGNAISNAVLLVEVNGQLKEISKMELGLPVSVKLDAFPFQEYGDLEGELIFISKDTFCL